MTGAITCRRCGSSVPIPEEARRDPAVVLVCPACGQRYARRRKASPQTKSQPALTSSGFTSAGTAAGAPAPARAPAPRPTPVSLDPTRSLVAMPGRLPTIFEAGAFVANRYRVVRFIARGGMGEVYEAEDLELRCRVALKTVHSGAAAEPGAVDRLKREIHLARRVTHPNVCRIFDVGFHSLAEPQEPIVFLTMELLEGETLAARLRRSGRLSPAGALPIARQMAAALEAAHRAGVVHRDFKTENVFLVPTAEGERVVVTDFGIARGGEDGFGVTLTSTGNVIGTPAYMAPEQIEGGEITPAVDQYALGVVLFEMVTGELPFQGENVLQTAARRLTEAPPPPSRLAPHLDERWEATILRCLARRPLERFRDVGAVARSLEGPLEPAPTPPQMPALEAVAEEPEAATSSRSQLAPGDRRKRWAAVLLLALLAAASVWAWYRIQAIRQRLVVDAPVAARRSVAVLTPRNLSGRPDSAWLGTALAEMLGTELGQGHDLRVIPGENVSHALTDLGLADVPRLDAEARARLRRRLGADYLVTGGYTALAEGGGVRLDLRLEDARSAETLATTAASGNESELFEMVTRAGHELRQALGAGSEPSARPALPTSPEAARLYAEGLDALRRFEPQKGRELLEQAVAADPGNALARSALATALGSLGYSARAEQEARQARELASGLPVEERMVVEARYFEAAREWASAAALWERLWAAYPDNAAYGLRVAACRTGAGQADLALAAALALRNLPAPENEDPRIDLAEATAAGALSDYRRQEEAAGRAVQRAEEQGARLLVAEALVSRGWALRNLGRSAEGRAAVERARALYVEAGDRAGAASADAALGGILLDLGALGEAQEAYQRSLEISRQLGDRGGEARALNNLAVLARSRGEMDKARAGYEQVAAIAAETGDRVGGAVAANNLASILAELGELDEAADRAQQAIDAATASGDKSGLASALGNLGAVRRRQGDLAAAQSAWERSLALRRETGQRLGEALSLAGLAQTLFEKGDLAGADERFESAALLARELSGKSALATALSGRGEIARERGDAAAARRLFDEALELRRQVGERAGIARLRVLEAELDLPGNAAAAVDLARELLTAPESERPPEVEAAERELLAHALRILGAPRDAASALTAEGLEDRLGYAARLRFELENARVAEAQGETLLARRAAAAVAEDARTHGFVAEQLEAELLAAELAGGDREEVGRRARGAGFLEIAARAAAPAEAPPKPSGR